MIVQYLTAERGPAFDDKEEARYPLKAKAGFYWQAEVEDPWIGPFESLEEAPTDGKQCCFGVI